MADSQALITALLAGHKNFSPQQLQGIQGLASNAAPLNPRLAVDPSYKEGQVIPQVNPNNPQGSWAIGDGANSVPDPTSNMNIPPDFNSIMNQLTNNKYVTKNVGWDI